jgi:hypothetical protein
MTKLSLQDCVSNITIDDLLLDRLIYGEFASSYQNPYFNLWFLGDNEKILPYHTYVTWDEPFLKKLYGRLSNLSKYNLQYVPIVEGLVFQRKDIKEVGMDNNSNELYFSTTDIYTGLEHRKIYRVKNKDPYVTPYHLYIDQDEDSEGVRGLTREHILRIAFYGVAL